MTKRAGDPIISLEGLDDLRERAAFLGKFAFADALQEAVNELADRGVEELSYRWSGAIEGGAVPFANVDPRSSRSAVKARKRSGATKGVAEASVAVGKKQSAFLKFQLGEADKREPGDAGAASEANFIPVPETLSTILGIKVTKQGNLPRNALKKLVALAREGRVGKTIQGRDMRGRYTASKEGRRYGNVFYGTPRSKRGPQQKGKRTQVKGFWWRPDKDVARLRPLAFAVPVSRYPKQSLVPVWNDALTAAGADLPSVLRPILERVIDARYGRRDRGYSKKLGDAREKRSTATALKAMKAEAEKQAAAASAGVNLEGIAQAKRDAARARKAAYDKARRARQKAR